MDLTYDDVLEILKIVESSSFDELHIEVGGLKLSLKRRRSGEAGDSQPAAAAAVAPDPPPVTPNPPLVAPRAAGAALRQGVVTIESPMLGIFYRSPSPGAPPFVSVGSRVREGDPVCIIEVMKLMNTITAVHGGRVAEILVEDEAMVEYGQALMLIETGV